MSGQDASSRVFAPYLVKSMGYSCYPGRVVLGVRRTPGADSVDRVRTTVYNSPELTDIWLRASFGCMLPACRARAG